jgi:hypothetical protein
MQELNASFQQFMEENENLTEEELEAKYGE